MHGHRASELRNLALHRRAFAKLRADPSLRESCLALVDGWLTSSSHAASDPWLREWKHMLAELPIEDIESRVMDDERGQTLRQCSPLGPALTPQERWAILREVP